VSDVVKSLQEGGAELLTRSDSEGGPEPRSLRTSGENLLGLVMTPSSQGLEPPGIPARLMASVSP
jgi:hypothetical protein